MTPLRIRIQSPQKRIARHAFSLVEVAIALGILSFGLLSIVGLLSVGLTSSRQNIDRSVEVQIMDFVRAQVKEAQTSGSLAVLKGKTFAFDSWGLYAGDPQPSSIYSATLDVPDKPLPGSQQTLQCVTVAVHAPVRANHALATNAFWICK